jgi:Putative Actinobacterial Holin-X, holin superfamily III
VATVVESEADHGVASLISGIAQDVHCLMAEQLSLFEAEIKNKAMRTAYAIIPLAAGLMILLPGLVTLALAAGYGLSALYPDLPAWAGLAIVGGVIGGAGATLVIVGVFMLGSINPVPETAIHELKENLAVLGEQKEINHGK